MTAKPSSPAPVFFIRLLVLLLAAGAVVVAFALGRESPPAAEAAAAYGCPMHADVTSAAPGTCPICGMSFERRRAPRPAAFIEANPLGLRPRTEVAPVLARTFSPEVRAPAWVDDDGTIVALLYKDEIAALAPDQSGSFVPGFGPGAPVEVLPAGRPPAAWDDATAQVRFRATGAAAPIPGNVGRLSLAGRSHELLVVPADDAVVLSPAGPAVFVAAPDGRSFARRPIEIGRVFYRQAVVTQGLHSGEGISVGDPFFLEAEQRLARAARPPEGTP